MLFGQHEIVHLTHFKLLKLSCQHFTKVFSMCHVVVDLVNLF